MTIDDAISDLTELKICGVVPFTKGTISGGNYKVITGDCLDEAIDTMRKYQMFQTKYIKRLKADMVAMLTEIQIEFDEKYWRDTQGYIIRRNGFNSGIEICIDIIQQKINSLKEAD